jgi:hypothetical protein
MPLLTSAQLQNAIRLDACVHDPLCHGYRWSINDEDTLAQLVAWTMQGHYQHAERVLASLNFAALPARPTFQQQAISRLTLPPGLGKDEPTRWHRDGLVFQHIAWLAAVIEGGGLIADLMPHLRPADKGFDSLLIPLTTQREAVSGLFICEEKATENPRTQIRDEVWPSILTLEAGLRDAELNGHVMAILREYQVQNIDTVAADLHWLGRKSYRVSITISPAQDGDTRRTALFKDYDDTAPGHMNRRRAETLALPNLRDWMDSFCARVIAAIEAP